MSALATYEDYVAFTDAQRKQFAAMPVFKSIALDFETRYVAEEGARKQLDIDFSNQDSWEVEGFGVLSLDAIALIAHSRLPRENAWVGTNKKNGKPYNYAATPNLYDKVSPVWETLNRIQAGKVAQGLVFTTEYKALADFIEASLA
jgi:hypothetical protein